MSSLQDQLLKAGLVDKKKAKQVKKDKQKKNKQQYKSKEQTEDETKARAKQAQQVKAEKDRQLNAERDAQAQQKAIEAQIKQLIEVNRQERGEGDIAYNFKDGTKIKKIYVSAKVQEALSRGQLGITKLNDKYELVPSAIVEKISARDLSYVITLNERSTADSDEDDPYADYEIPDDLMW